MRLFRLASCNLASSTYYSVRSTFSKQPTLTGAAPAHSACPLTHTSQWLLVEALRSAPRRAWLGKSTPRMPILWLLSMCTATPSWRIWRKGPILRNSRTVGCCSPRMPACLWRCLRSTSSARWLMRQATKPRCPGSTRSWLLICTPDTFNILCLCNQMSPSGLCTTTLRS